MFRKHARPAWPTARNGARIGESLVAVFALGVTLFSPLVIGIFESATPASSFGIPLLYLYLFAAWALVIALLAWVIEGRGGRGGRSPDAEPPAEREGDPS